MASRIAWQFIDPVTDDTYMWPVNPNTDTGSHVVTKSTAYQASAANYTDLSGNAHFGSTLIYKKPNEQEKFSYKGFVYTRSELENLQIWVDKDYAVQLVDDLDRNFLIYIENFQITRARSRRFPWKHSYVLSGLVLEQIV